MTDFKISLNKIDNFFKRRRSENFNVIAAQILFN